MALLFQYGGKNRKTAKTRSEVPTDANIGHVKLIALP